MGSVAFEAGAEGLESLGAEVDPVPRGRVGGCACPFLCTAIKMGLASVPRPLVMDSRGTAFVPGP